MKAIDYRRYREKVRPLLDPLKEVIAGMESESAWAYAEAAQGRGKPRVLVVHPLGDMGIDDSTISGGVEQDAFTCEAAYVERVLTRKVQ